MKLTHAQKKMLQRLYDGEQIYLDEENRRWRWVKGADYSHTPYVNVPVFESLLNEGLIEATRFDLTKAGVEVFE